MQAGSVVYILEDDSISLKSYHQLLSKSGFRVEPVSLENLAHSYSRSRPACLIARHSNSVKERQNIMQVLEAACDRVPPTIIVTSRIGVSTVVRLMEAGAFTVFQSPIPDERFNDCLCKAIEFDQYNSKEDERLESLIMRRRRLSAREGEIADLIVDGKSNREVANDLEIAVRTVEANRSRIFTKFGVASVAELASEWTELRLRESWQANSRDLG